MRLMKFAALAAMSIVCLNANAELPFNGKTKVKRPKSSNYCHPPGTRYFTRITKYYTLPLEQCLAGGTQTVTDEAGVSDDIDLKPGQLPTYLQTAYAAQQACTPGSSSACEQAAVAADKAKEEAKQLDRFVGFRFGIGLSALNFNQQSIDSVDLVGGEVFVRERRDIETSIMFESHKFFTIP